MNREVLASEKNRTTAGHSMTELPKGSRHKTKLEREMQMQMMKLVVEGMDVAGSWMCAQQNKSSGQKVKDVSVGDPVPATP